MKFFPLLLLPPIGFAAGYFLRPSDPAQHAPLIPMPSAEKSKAVPETAGEMPPASDAAKAALPQPAPPRSLADALKFPGPFHRGVAARRYFDSLPVSELPRAMQELLATRDAPGNEVVTNLFRSWAARAPEQAAQSALSLPVQFDRQNMAAAAARMWARFSPDAARQWVAAHLEGDLRKNTLIYIDSLADQQRESMIDPLERIKQALPTGDKETWSKLRNAFGEITRADPKQAARLFAAFPENRQFSNLARLVFAALVRTDAAEAAKFFAQLSPKNANAALKVVDKGLPEGAAPAVRDYALTLPAGDARATLLGSVAQTMLFENPDAADAFVASLLPGERFKGMHDYWEISAAGDPVKTAAQFVRMRAEAGADAASDLDLADILRRGSMRFPAKGAEAALLLQPDERDELLDSLAPQWVSRDPQAAFAWAANVADESARASAIYKIASHAAEHDATQAAQWTEQLPAGPARDSAALAMAEQVFDTDPDGALTWARSLSTGKGRIAALLSAVGHWRERTTTAEWLKNAPLTTEERAALKKRAAQPLEE